MQPHLNLYSVSAKYPKDVIFKTQEEPWTSRIPLPATSTTQLYGCTVQVKIFYHVLEKHSYIEGINRKMKKNIYSNGKVVEKTLS